MIVWVTIPARRHRHFRKDGPKRLSRRVADCQEHGVWARPPECVPAVKRFTVHVMDRR